MIPQINILNDVPEMHLQLVSSHGMLAILEVLEGKCSRDVTMKLLQILNTVRDIFVSVQRGASQPVITACYRRPGVLGELLLDWRHPNYDGCAVFRMYVIYCWSDIRPSGFTSKKYSSECRLEASNFIRLLCHTSVLTLQMFISYVMVLGVSYCRLIAIQGAAA